METYDNILSAAQNRFQKLVKKPERYLEPNPELFEEIKLLTKVLYDVGKLSGNVNAKTLPELIIKNFDEEQVWTGLELQNSENLELWRKKVSRLKIDDANLLVVGADCTEERIVNENDDSTGNVSDMQLSDLDDDEDKGTVSEDNLEEDGSDDFDEDIFNDPDFQNMSDSDGDDLPLFEDLSEEDKSGDEEGTYREREKRATKTRKSIVDDKFFKLSDMEKFLELEDLRDEKRRNQDSVENDEDEFNHLDIMTEIDDDPTEGRAMYSAFFLDEPGSSSLINKNGKDKRSAEESKEVEESSSDDEHIENNEVSSEKKRLLFDEDDDDSTEELKVSNYEKSQARLQDRIKKLEEKAVGDKPWQMGGEVAAPVRPENSLLAEDLEYESGVRQAPVITEEVARKLEDIIKQRVKDAAWDDVQRKVKPVENPLEYRKKLVLDQEKSKLSLAQVYEEEYLKVAKSQEKEQIPGLLDKENEEFSQEVEDIKSAMKNLFSKLDTLTHFHYTPKQKSAEIKIVRNVPSINMEEVAPTSASNADLLAPAEVIDKSKGELMEQGDKTGTDRKRERRNKKIKKKTQLLEKARREKLSGDENMSKKKEMQKALKNLESAEKAGKVKTIKEKDKNHALKSSTAFFNVLEDEKKKEGKFRKKDKSKGGKLSLSALKL